MRWFNSFGFITIMVFSFAFLTTLVFPTSEEKGNLASVHTLVQADGSQSLARFMPITASHYGESDSPVFAVRGP